MLTRSSGGFIAKPLRSADRRHPAWAAVRVAGTFYGSRPCLPSSSRAACLTGRRRSPLDSFGTGHRRRLSSPGARAVGAKNHRVVTADGSRLPSHYPAVFPDVERRAVHACGLLSVPGSAVQRPPDFRRKTGRAVRSGSCLRVHELFSNSRGAPPELSYAAQDTAHGPRCIRGQIGFRAQGSCCSRPLNVRGRIVPSR